MHLVCKCTEAPRMTMTIAQISMNCYDALWLLGCWGGLGVGNMLKAEESKQKQFCDKEMAESKASKLDRQGKIETLSSRTQFGGQGGCHYSAENGSLVNNIRHLDCCSGCQKTYRSYGPHNVFASRLRRIRYYETSGTLNVMTLHICCLYNTCRSDLRFVLFAPFS